MDTFSASNTSVFVVASAENHNYFGTAFAFASSSSSLFLMTCAHVVRNLGSKNLLVGEDRVRADTVWISDEHDAGDFAILIVDKASMPNVPLLPLAHETKSAYSAAAVGYLPMDSQRYAKQAFRGELHEPILLTSKQSNDKVGAWVSPFTGDLEADNGISGAPVMDIQTGNVIGLIARREGQSDKLWVLSIDRFVPIRLTPTPPRYRFVPILEVRCNRASAFSSNEYRRSPARRSALSALAA